MHRASGVLITMPTEWPARGGIALRRRGGDVERAGASDMASQPVSVPPRGAARFKHVTFDRAITRTRLVDFAPTSGGGDRFRCGAPPHTGVVAAAAPFGTPHPPPLRPEEADFVMWLFAQ